jgi:hypothetical protein
VYAAMNEQTGASKNKKFVSGARKRPGSLVLEGSGATGCRNVKSGFPIS